MMMMMMMMMMMIMMHACTHIHTHPFPYRPRKQEEKRRMAVRREQKRVKGFPHESHKVVCTHRHRRAGGMRAMSS